MLQQQSLEDHLQLRRFLKKRYDKYY